MNSNWKIVLLFLVGKICVGDGFEYIPISYEFALKGDDTIENFDNGFPYGDYVRNGTVNTSTMSSAAPTNPTSTTSKPESTTETVVYVPLYFVPDVFVPQYPLFYDNLNGNSKPADNLNPFVDVIHVESFPVIGTIQEEPFNAEYYSHAEPEELHQIFYPSSINEQFIKKPSIEVQSVPAAGQNMLDQNNDPILNRILSMLSDYERRNKTNSPESVVETTASTQTLFTAEANKNQSEFQYEIRTDHLPNTNTSFNTHSTVSKPEIDENQPDQHLDAKNETKLVDFASHWVIVDKFVMHDGTPCVKEVSTLHAKILYRYTCEEKRLEKLFPMTTKSNVLQFTEELSTEKDDHESRTEKEQTNFTVANVPPSGIELNDDIRFVEFYEDP